MFSPENLAFPKFPPAEKLGWDEIDCVYVEMDETEREMWEIAVNLHRVDLTKEERDRHIRRYAALLEKKLADVEQAVPRFQSAKPGETGLGQQVADQTGLSKRTVNRVLNPPDSTVPNEEADDQERVYNNLCKW